MLHALAEEGSVPGFIWCQLSQGIAEDLDDVKIRQPHQYGLTESSRERPSQIGVGIAKLSMVPAIGKLAIR